MTADRIADVVTVFINAGVDTLYGMRPDPKLVQGVSEAEQRTGKKCITIAIPALPTSLSPEGMGEAERELDAHADLGVAVCMPHQCATNAFVTGASRPLRGIAEDEKQGVVSVARKCAEHGKWWRRPIGRASLVPLGGGKKAIDIHNGCVMVPL